MKRLLLATALVGGLVAVGHSWLRGITPDVYLDDLELADDASLVG